MVKKASEWFVAGLGTATTSAAWLTASGSMRISETTILGFGLSGTNPWSLLPFYPLVFVAFPLCREAVDFFFGGEGGSWRIIEGEEVYF